EVVSVDSTDVHNVKRSSMAYQKDVLGIVSTAPGFVAGSYTDGSYPIALVGRVPVNVSSENGLIKAGDRITAASIPGYAMRATVAGRVLGTAMESMNLDNMTDCPAGGNGGTDAKCGQITVFVNLADYQGMSVDSLMAEVTDNSLDVDDSAVAAATDPNSPFAEYTSQGKVLDFLENLKNNQANYSAADILAGNINAVGQMVSPLIVTDTLVAKNIKAENIEGLQFIQTGIQSAQDGVASNTTEVNNLGQQITSLQASLKTLTDKSAGLDASTIEDFTTSGGLTVGGLAQFNGPAMFKAVAEFVDKVVFHNNVSFEGQVTFNQDAAGYAIVKEGTDNVVVEFSQEYSDAPIVNANVSLQQIKDDDIRHATENLLLTSDANFIITNVTTKGFEIRINQKAIYDIPFSWTAIAVKDVKTFDASDNTDTPVSADGSQVVPTGTNTNTNPTATEPTVPGATATSSTTAASDLVNTATENTDTAARDTGGSQSVLSSTGITTTNTNATTNTAANVSATTTP
ncbi:MAG: H-type lectin domain-containing protein, partial [Candidatus Pacebacteria bacterium]|nr:H-type lectin domain-containing protein [Candidatus Paceibacterota bacterium]